MALRYLARKVGIPALLRALGPRVSPSVGASRPLTSGSYQGGRNNGAGVGARKPLTDADLYKIEAEFAAESEAVKKAISDREANWRSAFRYGAAGLGFRLFTIGLTVREEKKRARAFRFD